MLTDLSKYSFFEGEKDSMVELFINGESRYFGRLQGDSRVYVIVTPTVLSDLDDDDLPF